MARKVKNHRRAAHAPQTVEKIRRLRASAGQERVNSYQLTFRLLDPDSLAPTVTASGHRDLVHPSEDRFLTARELARLQTFPDSHEFKGHRLDSFSTKRGAPLCQNAQIGNAVPARLALVVARSVKSQLFVDPTKYVDLRAAEKLPRVVARLNQAYPWSRLGNKCNAVDELVYILLSRQTNEKQYQEGYRVFRRAYRRWELALDAPSDEVAAKLEPLGLAEQKTRALKASFAKLKADFGRVTLAPLRRWPTWRAMNYLTGLLGINEKSAKCILMYCFGRQVFPVDTHALRINRRLGIVRPMVPEWTAPRWIEMVVPPELRLEYHVRCVQHGRATCSSRNPSCAECCIRADCPRIGV